MKIEKDFKKFIFLKIYFIQKIDFSIVSSNFKNTF